MYCDILPGKISSHLTSAKIITNSKDSHGKTLVHKGRHPDEIYLITVYLSFVKVESGLLELWCCGFVHTPLVLAQTNSSVPNIRTVAYSHHSTLLDAVQKAVTGAGTDDFDSGKNVQERPSCNVLNLQLIIM